MSSCCIAEPQFQSFRVRLYKRRKFVPSPKYSELPLPLPLQPFVVSLKIEEESTQRWSSRSNNIFLFLFLRKKVIWAIYVGLSASCKSLSPFLQATVNTYRTETKTHTNCVFIYLLRARERLLSDNLKLRHPLECNQALFSNNAFFLFNN